MKLSDYIERKEKEERKLDEDRKREKRLQTTKIDDYRKNFMYYSSSILGNKINKLDFIKGVKCSEEKIDFENFPYHIQYEIEITINNNTAQYFLNIKGDIKQNDVLFLSLESVGYQNTIETKLEFDKTEKYDIESYLTETMEKFKSL